MASQHLKTICVIGLGYVGLPTALIFARAGLRVKGYDQNINLVADLNQGKTVINEDGMQAMLQDALAVGAFSAHDEIQPADAYFICVPTPIDEMNAPDLSAVWSAIEKVQTVLQGGNLVVLESTSPVSTTRQIYDKLTKHLQITKPTVDRIYAAYCPERVLPGRIIEELTTLDRVVGGIDTESAELAKEYFSQITSGECYETQAETAEFVKLAENSFRDVNIAFANELKNLCDAHNVPVNEVRRFANMHPRVKILDPGIGVGGHCIPIDPWFLIHNKNDEKPSVIQAARLINNLQPLIVVDQVLALSQQHSYKRLSIFGLTYKANVNDFRESPAMEILRRLADTRLFAIEAYDPFIPHGKNEEQFPGTTMKDTHSVFPGDLNLFLVAHNEFRPVVKEFSANNHPILNVCNL